MKTSVLIVLALFGAQAAASSRLIVPQAPDLMIKTRRTMDRPGASVVTDVIYLKGARQRRETVVEVPSHTDIGGVTRHTSGWIQIAQCDERRMLLLYPEAKTYVYEPIEDPAAAIARLRAAASLQPQAPPREVRIGPALTITLDAVDTGERRQFANYVARHVITTRTIESSPETRTGTSVETQDGWYIDVPPLNCVEANGLTTSIFAVSDGAAHDRVTFKRRGTASRGYPIEETETHRFGERQDAIGTRLELVELSEAPLDDALFTIPDDYRPALPRPYGGYDYTKPDTWTNRIESYREYVAAWANYVRQHGLRGVLWGPRPSGY